MRWHTHHVLLSILSLSALCKATESSQSILDDLNPYPDKPRITFNKKDGTTFRLTVFSDLHFGENPWETWGPEQDRRSERLIGRVLEDEKPDFAVINGDLVTGESTVEVVWQGLKTHYVTDTFRENVTRLIDQIVLPFNRAETPFAATLGNHDNQANITHAEEIEHMNKASRFSYTRFAPRGVGGFGGEGNYWVPVYESVEDRVPVLILWFFDSRGGIHPNPDSKTAVPDWVDSTVADWIRSEVLKMDAAWGPATTTSSSRSAVAFVHIPPHAIQDVQPTINPIQNPGLNADVLGQGSVQDSQQAKYNRQDAPFWDSVNSNIKNLRTIISGHAHGNEWCARERKKNVIFCFDKHSGYGGYDRPGWGHGVRNLLFRRTTMGIETWIRFENGTVGARVVLDADYDK